MDDSRFGKEDSRGFWTPKEPVSYGPAFDWPPRPKALVQMVLWLSRLSLAVECFVCGGRHPDLDVPDAAARKSLKTFSFGWAGLILLRNIVLALLVYGAWHLWLYVWRKQGTSFKYNRQWPKESPAFLFRNQTYDNMFYTLASGVPIWTAYEVLLLWAYANNVAPMISYAEHPVGFIALFFLVPFIHEVGSTARTACCTGRRSMSVAHKLHHRNTNPGPWSGLSMHPIEHVIYFSTIALFFLIPAHPDPHDQSRLAAGAGPGAGAYGI